jgi:hypothetical protein
MPCKIGKGRFVRGAEGRWFSRPLYHWEARCLMEKN